MTAPLDALVLAVARGWLRLYTAGLAADTVACRRDEIESDLWHMQHDPDSGGAWRRTLHTLRRLVHGMPDDIGWRMDVAADREQLLTRRVIALAAAAVVVTTLWSLPAVLLKGRRELTACADAAPPPRDTAALRHEVLRCAGSFFAARERPPS